MKKLFVIAQSWPCERNGGSIAVTASLRQFEACFDEIVYVCLHEWGSNRESDDIFSKTKFVHVPIRRGSFAKRFAGGLISGMPAMMVGIGGQSRFDRMKRTISEEICSRGEREYYGVFDNNTASIHLPALKGAFPGITWAFRSHDVVHKAFSVFAREGNYLLRLAWRREIRKILEIEREATQAADINWTITEDDKAVSERAYSTRIDGVFDVDIESDQYINVAPGNKNTILYLGSADHRKRHGLMRFIKEVWPVLTNDPDIDGLRFVLGGRHTEVLSDMDRNIEGRGYVDDEIGFLSEGMFFLNPQEAGSGLKLKSLIAMAAGKVLITTPNGALGLGGEAGTHYVVGETYEHMARELKSLLLDGARAAHIAQAGRDHVKKNYSHSAFSARVHPLIRAFIEAGKKRGM